MDYFDLHCDTPFALLESGQSILDGNLAVSVKKSGVFERYCQVCALWIPDNCRDPQKRYSQMLANLLDQIRPTVRADELKNSPAFLLSVEGGSVIRRVYDVDRLADDGIRVITLTWNGKNRIAGGSNTTAGLTDFGYDVIMQMNKRKIAVDLSHLNDRSFGEVIAVADNVIVTHACCRSVFVHRRNLTDEQLTAVVRRGGIIGLCLYPDFLGGVDVFDNIAAHLNKLLKLGAENNIAIGSDFDGAPMDTRLDGIDKIPLLYERLIENGFSRELLDRLFYENAYAYFEKLLN